MIKFVRYFLFVLPRKALICVFCLLVSLFCASGASAVDYYWTGAPSYPSAVSSSPQSVIDMIVASFSSAFVHTSDGACYFDSATIYKCPYKRKQGSQSAVSIEYTAYRQGDSCPSGTEYDSTTGECKEPENPCESKEGQAVSFRSTGILPTNSACIDSCSATLFDSDRYTDAKGNTRFYYSGTFNGSQCSGSNPPSFSDCALETDCTKESIDPVVDASNSCTHTQETDANGFVVEVYNCVKNETAQQDEKQDCTWGVSGAGDGQWTCVSNSKAKINTWETKTETKTTTNADGSKDTVTTTTKTETKCTGAGSCSTNTTQNVNNNHTNADGSAGDSSSSCKGTDCKTGDGNGVGDGDGEGEEEGEDSDIAGPTQSLAGPAQPGDFSAGIAEWDQKITDIKSELGSKVDQLTASFQGVFGLNLGEGSGALPCDKIPIKIGNASANLDFCIANYKDQLIYLRYALLLAAAVIAAFVVMRD